MVGATAHSETPSANDRPPAFADPFGRVPVAWAPRPLAEWTSTAWHGAALLALVCWVPLAVLSAIQGLAIGLTRHESFLFDYAAYGRYLVAAPAFAYAGVVVLPQLTRVVRQFVDAGIVADHDRARYEALVASTRRLMIARWTEVVLVASSVGLGFVTTSLLYPDDLGHWVMPAGAGGRSLAGWWRLLVSQPLFHLTAGVWMWRILLWVRFLYRTTQLDLNLVASHPDLLGGLRFALMPLRGFTLLSFGIGAFVAGSIADSVLSGGRPLESYRYLIGAQVVFVLVLLAGPSLLLMAPLVRLQEWGTFHYGRLAADVGHAFQRRWLLEARHAGSDSLATPDFSATTDLYAIAANVRGINPFVLDLRILIMLAVASLIPYVPLFFAVLPLEDIIGYAMKALI